MLIFYFLIPTFFTLAHPLHVSVTEVTLDDQEKELEIVLRIFTDDLELAIQKEEKDAGINLLKPEGTTTDKLAWEYLQSKFKLSVDGKPQPVKYLGHEADGDVLVFYIQVQPVKKFRIIDITNHLLTELYEDQANLVNITVRDETKSLRLMRDNPSGKLTFDLK